MEQKPARSYVSYRSIFTIALPMVVSQASETINLFVDRLFLSSLGEASLAGSMSGGLTAFTAFSLFAAAVGYVNAIVAQYYGAGKYRRCARTAVQGIYASLLMAPLILLFLPLGHLLFTVVGHSAEQISLEYTYFRIIISGSFLILIRNVFTGFFLGQGKSGVVMLANLAGMIVNVPANYLLIFGKAGLPAMGIAGAATGTLIGSGTSALVFFLYYISKTTNDRFLTRTVFRPDKELFLRLLRFGMPAGVETFLNVTAFNLFLQLMLSYGSEVAAAVTITMNYDLVAFVPMIGLSFAATAVVGQKIGAADYPGAIRSSYMIMRISFVYAGSMILLFLLLPRPLVTIFTSGLSNPETVIPLSILLLRMAALYILADAVQLVFAGALRGAGDTRFVMQSSVIIHWLFAGCAFLLVKIIKISPQAMWALFILFVMSLGLIMFLRFRSNRWQSIKLIE